MSEVAGTGIQHFISMSTNLTVLQNLRMTSNSLPAFYAVSSQRMSTEHTAELQELAPNEAGKHTEAPGGEQDFERGTVVFVWCCPTQNNPRLSERLTSLDMVLLIKLLLRAVHYSQYTHRLQAATTKPCKFCWAFFVSLFHDVLPA